MTAIVPIDPNVPAPPADFAGGCDLLEADEWDDMELADWLARPAFRFDGEGFDDLT